MVLQCVACIQKENRKFCLAAEGLGNRLCYLEPTSEAKVGQTRRLLHALSPPPPHCTCFSSGIQLHQPRSDVEANAFSVLKEVNRMKRRIHCGENSMETRHPVRARRHLVE